ncbi:MAG: hypothetical protein NXI04_27220 [Planctomycetaceae bacterium]|nr:hypothetical protein [Planctomycetaceae bacterium]
MNSTIELSTQDESAPRVRRRWKRQAVFCSAAFFVSYVITAGPAVFMARRFDQPMFDRIVKVLYAPLILLVKADVPVISPLIEAWVKLFR